MSTPVRSRKPPRIVAELGRPETPEETLARKAAGSRAHRANQTLRNLVLALLASLVVVFITVAIVVRPDPQSVTTVDFHAAANQVQPGVAPVLANPRLPSGWKANDAELKEGDGQGQTWYIGLITPDQSFVAIEQGIGTTNDFVSSVFGKTQSTGSRSIAGVDWRVYDHRTDQGTGNFTYSLSATITGTPVVLHGTAGQGDFTRLATAVTAQLRSAKSAPASGSAK